MPQYVCLYDNLSASSNNGVPVCGTCARAMTLWKKWSDYSGTAKTSLVDFTPSCRNVRFDCHVTTQNPRQVFIVVKCTLQYEAGQRGSPEWAQGNKNTFMRNLQTCVGLWDARVAFRHCTQNGNVDHTPLFFVDLIAQSKHTQSKVIVVSAAEPNRLDTGLLNYNCGDLVTLNGPYPDKRPVARAGQNYQSTVRVVSIAPRTFVLDTSVADARKEYVNSMAHEFGHLVGLPDEYDRYGNSFDAGNLASGRVQRGNANSDKDKCVAFWVEMLAECGLASPAWGQYGPMAPQINEHSVMRNIDTRDASFIQRHYVTVLEALNYMSVHKGLGGYWEMA